MNTNFLNSTNFLIQNPNYKISAAQLIVNIHKRHNFTVSEVILKSAFSRRRIFISNYDWLTEWHAKEKGYFKPIKEMILKYVEISWN